MDLLHAAEGKYTFHLREREKLMLCEVLKLYPVIEKPYQPLSKTAEAESIKTDQELLHESLATHQAANKKAIETLLGAADQFVKDDKGYCLTLDDGQVEMLLQVLNDIRVGSWRALGSPDEGTRPALNDHNLVHLIALEIAGVFQSSLLSALDDPP